MKKILTKILTICLMTIIGIGVFGLAKPVLAVGETEVLFENTPLFNEANFVPGQSVSRWVKFKNNTAGTLMSAVKAKEVINPDNFGNWFEIIIREGATVIYDKTLTEFFNANEIMLSNVNGGVEKQYDFAITFKPETGNDYQGKTLSFDIQVGVGSEDAIGDETGGETGGTTGGGGSTGGGGGGGYNYNGIIISGETGFIMDGGKIKISWATSKDATSRVVYDNISHLTLGLPPNYGYQWSTPETENAPMVTGHNVLIDLSGFTAGTYYFRPISHGSPEVYGKEIAFVINNTGQITKIIYPDGQTPLIGLIEGEQINNLNGEGQEGSGGTSGGANNNLIAGVAGESEENSNNLPTVLGENKVVGGLCALCANYNWLIIILLFLIIILIYQQINNCLDNYNLAKEKKYLIKSYAWGLLVLVGSFGVGLVLYLCGFKLLTPAVLLLGLYLILLALNIYRKKGGLWWLWGLILALIPTISYYYCTKWGWKSWVLAIILYITTLGFYFAGLLMRKFWLVVMPLSLIILAGILALSRCLC